MKYIAKSENETMGLEITQSKFVSLLSDVSTDVSITENEIIYIRICVAGVIKVSCEK